MSGVPLLVGCCCPVRQRTGPQQGGEQQMTIEIMEVEEITATRIHLDPDAYVYGAA
ncbi:hypothetical protein CTKZ_05810 [Cellulomonas algicola]|uniref:Uncharacterized protein n=1 Tax=Cellulomonas algicola TaxID=2071633 RepID=A0A401UWG0_9CELL|nr:hypothetical protein [Cellulomonas algicola]GCD19019.1 hypothetical protein CTKZ_05810 [Cellulomonas algicola]